MSRFRLAPQIGLLERLKRLYGYLLKTKHFAIRCRTKEPNYSNLPVQEHAWSTETCTKSSSQTVTNLCSSHAGKSTSLEITCNDHGFPSMVEIMHVLIDACALCHDYM